MSSKLDSPRIKTLERENLILTKKVSKKCSPDQRLILKRHTTYKIGTLINKKNSYNFFFHMLQVSKKFPTVYITGSVFSIMYNRNLRVLIELLENYNPFDFDSLLKLGEL